jgi:hypothetical protein
MVKEREGASGDQRATAKDNAKKLDFGDLPRLPPFSFPKKG